MKRSCFISYKILDSIAFNQCIISVSVCIFIYRQFQRNRTSIIIISLKRNEKNAQKENTS